jgi:hypothetical protein
MFDRNYARIISANVKKGPCRSAGTIEDFNFISI